MKSVLILVTVVGISAFIYSFAEDYRNISHTEQYLPANQTDQKVIFTAKNIPKVMLKYVTWEDHMFSDSDVIVVIVSAKLNTAIYSHKTVLQIKWRPLYDVTNSELITAQQVKQYSNIF